MKTIVNTKDAPEPLGPYNQAVKVDNTLYASGQIAIDPVSGALVTGGIEEETRQVLKNLQAVLTEAGMEFKNVVKTTIFLKDMSDFAKLNAIYGEFFTEDFPARETVQVAALPKNVNVEISVIAVK